ncbi:hypothetical protein SBRCBS47491_001228 [Sporothrix bragantina]|uniref:Transcriptional coactivator p15 (PC4) C-terminal domain-containing protein n=1 Tax=Sporothrix bragantina TaxID=671064 RepID=A0ABP0AWW3_9PEZI
MGEKRSYSDADGGAGKLAKKSSGSDVASSKAKKGGSAGAPPREQDQEGNAYWELSKMRRIGIAHFRSTTLINIREYYESGGQMRPGKKGISLSLDQYKALIRAIPDINAALRDDGVAISDAEDDEDGGAATGAGESSSKVTAASKEKKAKVPKKSNIEATSDEDSS